MTTSHSDSMSTPVNSSTAMETPLTVEALTQSPTRSDLAQAGSRAMVRELAFEMRRGTPLYVPMEERLQAAKALQERLSSVPFYANRAAKAKERGDEMEYWLDLQSSQATAHRR